MAFVSRDKIQLVFGDSIAPGNDVQTSPIVPAGQRWQITRVIFADKGINDGLSGGFLVDFGSGGSRETIAAAYLTGSTIIISINRMFTGDGSAKFRYIRSNNASVAKEMYLLIEGFKRFGDL